MLLCQLLLANQQMVCVNGFLVKIIYIKSSDSGYRYLVYYDQGYPQVAGPGMYCQGERYISIIPFIIGNCTL